MSESVPEKCDVVVIGGGPAGSTAAALLAIAGRDVVLLEKATFPRYHVGESLLGIAPTILDRIGVREEVESQRFVRKYGGSFIWGKNREQPWHWRFTEVPDNPTYSYHVRRAEFDQVLLSNAVRLGTNVYQDHRVTCLIHEDGRVAGVAYTRPDGSEGEIRSAYTVIASGQDSLALEPSHSFEYNEDFKNIAVFSYYSPALAVPNWDPEEPRGNQIVVAFEEGWFWVIPQSEEYSSVGAVVSHRSFSQLQKMGAEAFLDAMIAKCPHVAALVSGARRTEQVRVIRDYSFTFKDYSGPGYFRTGDAAVFVDPLWSYGVSNAMRTSVLAACSINSLLGAVPDAREEVLQSAFQETLESFYDHMIRLLLYFYNAHRDMSSYFWKTHNLSYAIRESSQKETFIKVLSGGSYLIHDKLHQGSSEVDPLGESAREVFDRFTAEGDTVPLKDAEWTEAAIAEVFDSLAGQGSPAMPAADARLAANYPVKSYLYVDPEKLVAQALVSVYHQNRLTTLSSVALDVVRAADGQTEVAPLIDDVAKKLSVPASSVRDEMKLLLDGGILRVER